jgi:Zn-dependent protease with chaperone function
MGRTVRVRREKSDEETSRRWSLLGQFAGGADRQAGCSSWRRGRLCVVVLAIACWWSPLPMLAQSGMEQIEGYAEWHQGDLLIVDGQRVVTTAATRFRGSGEVKDLASIPLGYEVNARGVRRKDGVIEATQVEAKPNGIAMFEAELIAQTRKVEAFYLEQRQVPGEPTDHRLLVGGAQVERVRRIAMRLIPPYRDEQSFRFYVVEDPEWNAGCYPNGMVVVNQGLLQDMNDDEVALVLGHEIAHGTHEHSRRRMKRQLFVDFVTDAGSAVAGSSAGGLTREAVLGAIGLSGLAATNSYSRDNEDQADRVGLRYAYEGGFDVTQAPRVWRRFARKYPSGGKVHNFFLGSHSLPTARAERLRREIALNYPQLTDKLAAAEGAPLSDEPADRMTNTGNARAETRGASIDLWVERQYKTRDNPLHTELSINDRAVGLYTSEVDEPLNEYLRPGWNTIALKTTPQQNVTQDNSLTFRIGPVARTGIQRSMEVVLWELSNKTDWDLRNGRYVHRLGPQRTDITLQVPVYYAGLEHEERQTKNGDYILKGKPEYGSWNGPVSATVFVNGTPLNTFLFSERDVVITPLLKAGRNEITLVSKRIANGVRDNDIQFAIYGPVQWNVGQNTFTGPVVVEFGSLQGWKHEPSSGAWISVANPAAESVERTISLLVKELPAPKP